ncbi:similar to Zygosaccharomyces rouxii ZYRO0G10450g hypothetical protein [Maudiozyma saulgeensis]|uniref:Zn(2)-C6 fungal-type domain-containing protein n=1 Tax=Maudiozyma saulgeensis TaxID=1789683 RepID=A0A1X7RAN7_9SACH|nr:similar to Zygosaccharomyces rouxii ZYRO0G10450g hypothetical protein [Kazachstania saulgeensis]
MAKKTITRKRRIKSCTYCYSHKLKCDRTTPCSTCVANGPTVECKYWSDNDNSQSTRPGSSSSKSRMIENMEWALPQDEVYGAKFLYPFFTPSMNDKVVSPKVTSRIILNANFVRNKITGFDKFARVDLQMKDVLVYLLDSKDYMHNLIDNYFLNVHPIIPILDKKDIESRAQDIYNEIEHTLDLNPLDVILLISVYFCSLYASLASEKLGTATETYRCYAIYRYLLDITKFPLVPYIETVQSFAVVNFIMDPNMREAVAYSAMLVRLGQQLNIPKKAMELGDKDNCLLYLWHYILFMEGSSSVASGFQFSTSKDVFSLVKLPVSPHKHGIVHDVPLEYTICRFKMNNIFQKIMELTTKNTISRTENAYIEEKIGLLYRDVGKVEGRLKHTFPDRASYYSSSLYIFLHRLHLRFFAFESLKLESGQNRNRSFGVTKNTSSKDIFWILDRKMTLRDEVVPLTLLLLLNTLERLVQPDCEDLNWYSKGSTVMQYLFVILRDLYQNPFREYPLSSFVEPLYASISFDIKEIIMCHPLLYKYKLIEELLKVLELRLAPLWSDNELYKFILVKMVKEKVWSKSDDLIKKYCEQFDQLGQCRLFVLGKPQQESMGISIDDFVTNLEPTLFGLDAEKILIDWLIDI